MPGEPREILAFWDGSLLMSALVPKTRGSGFLRVPAGHHLDERISAIEDATGHSIFGLDGALDVDLSARASSDANRRAWDAFVAVLARLYPFPVRIVEATEYWDRHPVKTDADGPSFNR